MFQTIRQTARITGLSECFIRKQVKTGKCPGVYSGNRFLVNVPALLTQLERESEVGANGN